MPFVNASFSKKKAQSFIGRQAGDRHERALPRRWKAGRRLGTRTGESLASYVSCHRQYRSLTTLDKNVPTPEHLQLEMMLGCASIADHVQQLARFAARKPLPLETMGLALIQEYPLIHDGELSRSRERPSHTRRPPTHRSSGRFQPGRLPASRACWSNAGHQAEEAQREDDLDPEEDGDDTQDDTAHLCNSCGLDDEFSEVVDRMAQDIVCAFVGADCSPERRVRSRGAHRVLRTGTSKTSWSDSGTGCTQLQTMGQSWRSESDENTLNKRRTTQRAVSVVARATSTNANWRKDTTTTDKDKTHDTGKDGRAKTTQSAQAKISPFRTRAPFGREARMAQTSSDRGDKRGDNCFKPVSLDDLCQRTLLAGRTTQHPGEGMRLSWTTHCPGDGKQETWTNQHLGYVWHEEL